MKCTCTTNFPIILIIIAIVLIVSYLRYRKDSCMLASLRGMQPTNLILYGLSYPHSLPVLKFAYNALEPHLDAETLNIHHTKHHQAYIDNLNKALQEEPGYQKYQLEELLANLPALPASIRERIRNNGGGHLAHTLFWDSLSPQSDGKPTATIAAQINKYFGSLEAFKEKFSKEAASHVGSGWTWLCLTQEKKLVILTTLNHDTPLSQGLYPILVLDIWEHAYYLKYRNKRGDFIAAWWNVINWKNVEKLYLAGLKKFEA